MHSRLLHLLFALALAVAGGMTGDRPRFGPLHNTPRWYLGLAVAWSAVVLSLPWMVVATMGERLPDPVASHWGADGVPDGFFGARHA